MVLEPPRVSVAVAAELLPPRLTCSVERTVPARLDTLLLKFLVLVPPAIVGFLVTYCIKMLD